MPCALEGETVGDSLSNAQGFMGNITNEKASLQRPLISGMPGRAFAAASIGQVHAAQLLDGTNVAVKIQVPIFVWSLLRGMAILSLL